MLLYTNGKIWNVKLNILNLNQNKETRQQMYKVVDIFNGKESKVVHGTLKSAKEELSVERNRFEDNMSDRHCLFPKEVVPATAKFQYDGREYVWK
jgi:hypothetical protein